MKKRILKGLLISILVVGAFTTGKITNDIKQEIKAINVFTESNQDFYIEDGGQIIEYSDGSFAYINEKENEYLFYPVVMGDWEYQAKDKQQLEMIINTYIENNI